MNYEEACVYLEKSYERNNKKGFEVMSKVLSLLGDPHKSLRIIHVAGTNGKGSTCACLTSILMSAGYRVGTFTSPHLIEYNERFSINNVNISNDDLARHVGLIKEATERALGSDSSRMSFFEIFTVTCFNYFNEQNVDLAVIETGLGGRHDPTNIIEKPLLSIITSIGCDHMNILGGSIEQIAFEKAGIIKKSCPSLLYCNQNAVYNIFQNTALQMDSDFYYSNQSFETIIEEMNMNGTKYSLKTGKIWYYGLFIKLLGDYQIYNTANVVYAAEVLNAAGLNIPRAAVYAGLAEARWRCRMEVVRNNPEVVLDGAHNVDAARVLLKACGDYFSDKNIYMIVGILSDKEYPLMAGMLSEIAHTVIFTQPDNKRAVDANELSKHNRCKGEIYIEEDYKKAYDLALSLSGTNGVIIVAGSLYLTGAMMVYIKSLPLN